MGAVDRNDPVGGRRPEYLTPVVVTKGRNYEYKQ